MSNKSNLPLAFLWTFINAMGFGTFSGVFKNLSTRYPMSEVIFFLVAPMFIFALIFLSIKRGSVFPKDKVRLLSIRAILGYFGWACYFYTIPHLALPIASMCYVSMPLFVFLLAPILIGEKLNKKCLPWVAASFIGIIMLIEPGPAMFSGAESSSSYLALGFLGALLAGVGHIANRKASASVPSETIVLYFSLVGILCTLPQIGSWLPIAQSDLFLFALLGFGGIVTQYACSQAFKYAPAAIVCTFGFVEAPICAVIGYIFFAEVLDMLQWSGIILLGIGISVLTFIKEEEKQHTDTIRN